jgi:hypothetical protein
MTRKELALYRTKINKSFGNYRNKAFLEIVRKIVDEDDLFQGGKLWIGEIPSNAYGDKRINEFVGQIEAKQVTINFIRQVVRRKTLAVVGATPNYSVVPKRTLGTIKKTHGH